MIKYIGICVGVLATSIAQAQVSIGDIFNTSSQCQTESIENAFLCGKISGRLNTLYYSTHNAYFVPDLNQDTITTGGFLKYETQPIAGLSEVDQEI